jgi:hypothetical protein
MYVSQCKQSKQNYRKRNAQGTASVIPANATTLLSAHCIVRLTKLGSILLSFTVDKTFRARCLVLHNRHALYSKLERDAAIGSFERKKKRFSIVQ